jgi:2',3'-cyclic-nucleotide 2'-phosphodiesterase (5'-nucleotidase family)
VITQAGENGQFLGRVDVYLAAGRTPHPLRRVEACLLPLGADVPQDPAVLAVLARHGAPLGESQFTCEAEVQNPAKGTSPMGVLVADALRAGANAQVGLLDRDAVASGLTPGPGTIADVCRVHPWRNRVLVGSLTGAQVQKALAGARVHASGCELQRTGPKVTGLTVGGLPAAPENTYSVAAGEYLVQTTPWLRDLSWRDSGARVETLLLRYLKQRVVVR